MKRTERFGDAVLLLTVLALIAAKLVFTYAVFSSELDNMLKIKLLTS